MQDENTGKTNPAESEELDISEYIPGHDLKRKQPDAMPEKGTGREKRSGINLGKIAFFGITGFFLLQFWFVGRMMIQMATLHRAFYSCVWTGILFGFFFFVYSLAFNSKKARRISYVIGLVCIVSIGMKQAWYWWTIGRYPVVTQDVRWHDYMPFQEGNKLVKIQVPEEYALDLKESIPTLNGAYALYPIYAAMAQGMYPSYLWGYVGQYRGGIIDLYNTVGKSGSDAVYLLLLDGKCDLVFALAPSKNQQEDAEKAGVKYELTPFCKDAFVFYVNAKNPVDNLTTEQIKGIYSGKITDWEEVGAPSSTKIIPFQRNEGSGSQTTLQKLMGDTPIMPPLKEDRLGGMGDIINDTANYRNYRAALGFSFRYYATELLKNDQIKLLSIDGVTPTVENIRNGTYPLVATAYMVTTDRPRSANVQKIIDFMLSPEGQRLVEETGYVPVAPTTPAE